jgi:DNA-binding transcriptional regulator PaaX
MKEEQRLKILGFIESTAQFIDDVLFVFSLPYGTSYSRMEFLAAKRQGIILRTKINRRTQRRFNDFVYKLRRDGFIFEQRKKNGKIFNLTSKGCELLKKLKLKKANDLPKVDYKSEKDDSVKIIIFDVPEEERRKRDWLRWALTNLKFNMLQKSVWVGRSKIPEEFISDLDKFKMLAYVEIFAITKTGSLREIKNNSRY